MTNSKKRLGRGLGGLISGAASSTPKESTASKSVVKEAKKRTATTAEFPASTEYREIAIKDLEANPYQPRREIDLKQVEELAESIRSEGLLQPVVVRPKGKKYELIAGERRLHAFKFLKRKKVPARVIDVNDASSATLALIENLQRENLNPIEEALGYASLVRDFDLTQEAVAERIGKGRASVANALRRSRRHRLKPRWSRAGTACACRRSGRGWSRRAPVSSRTCCRGSTCSARRTRRCRPPMWLRSPAARRAR